MTLIFTLWFILPDYIRLATTGISHFPGGGSLFAIHSECEVYNPGSDRWFPIASMSCRRSRAAVSPIGNLLYVVGGYDGSNDLSSGEVYHPLNNMWSPMTPMGTKRSCLGVCSVDGLMYCCGGYDGASCLSSVERYDPLTGVWTSCPAMTTRRRYCRVAVMGKLCHCWYHALFDNFLCR